MWKNIRVTVLLLILLVVVIDAWQEQRSLSWQKPLYVAVYPINPEQSASVTSYLSTLNTQSLEPIQTYLNQQAAQHGLALYRPITLQWGPSIDAIPPAPPQSGGVLAVIGWSLKLRYFAWRHQPAVPIRPNIRLYALFYDPKTHPRLAHSTALAKGQIGRINLFGQAKQTEQNWVVLTHELLHTLGATDKYDRNTNLPLDPEGLADPAQVPRYPQRKAELMGGRLAISAQKAVIPTDLSQTLIGPRTAAEIGWAR